ncbi:substrate-binding domain-containing protein [Pseudomonas aeruginosa]
MVVARRLQCLLLILASAVSWVVLKTSGTVFQVGSFLLRKFPLSRNMPILLISRVLLFRQGGRGVKPWIMASFLLLCGMQVARAEEVLKVLSWDTYIAPDVIKEFEGASGVKVDYKTFTNANELRRALESGERFDLVFPTDHQLRDFIDKGLIAALDVSLLPRFCTKSPNG